MSLQTEKENFKSRTINHPPTPRNNLAENNNELEKKEEDAYITVKWFGWYQVGLFALAVIIGLLAYFSFL